MSRKKKWIILSTVLVVVLAVPVYLVISSQALLNAGAEHTYKFKLRPVDPHDMLRGKYIALMYESNDAQPADSTKLPHSNDEVYVTVERDADGFAYMDKIYLEQPKGQNYFKTSVGIVFRRPGRLFRAPRMGVKIPFDRYYLNEDFAKQAEDTYRTETRERTMYAEVVIRDGESVLKEVYVDDTPLPEYMRKNKAEYEKQKELSEAR